MTAGSAGITADQVVATTDAALVQLPGFSIDRRDNRQAQLSRAGGDSVVKDFQISRKPAELRRINRDPRQFSGHLSCSRSHFNMQR
jgi:hypothetical protein